MEILIYNYEGAILRFIRNVLPSVNSATYASDEDLLLAMSEVKYFPSFYYSREDSEWVNNKIITIVDGSKTTKFCAFEQRYKGVIIVEDQKEAQSLASSLRFYWSENSKVTVAWPDRNTTLDVQLRLLYIKIKEARRPNDKKGSCRMVEFGWQSQLFMNPLKESSTSLVEKVNIKLSGEKLILSLESGKEIIINEIDNING